MRAAAGVGICGEHVSGRPGHPRPEHEPAIEPPPPGPLDRRLDHSWGLRRDRTSQGSRVGAPPDFGTRLCGPGALAGGRS